MQKALVSALTGQAEISGKLPVTIPGVANIGDGQVIEKNESITSLVKHLPGMEIIQVLSLIHI